jgi:methionyl-tRNA formyltransferase
LRIVFLGTPQFAVLPLEHLVENGYQVVAVFTQPDKPAGRGRHLVATPVKVAAATLSLPVLQSESLKKAGTIAELDELKPDAIVVAALGQILPKAVLDLPGYGSINIHPSLLPRHRGASPIPAAILAGDEFTGVSIMVMDEGLDTGPVLARAQIPISDADNTGSLTAKLSLLSAHLLQDVLSPWGRGQLAPQPQDEAGATYSGTISKEEGQIDWHLPAVDVWRQVRAFNPWPGSHTRWRGELLKIIEAMPLYEVPPASEGRVITLPGGGFGVGTGSGVLAVLTVQAAGKQAVPAAAFLRGQRQLIGAKLPC